jgi:hypothetical protein
VVASAFIPVDFSVQLAAQEAPTFVAFVSVEVQAAVPEPLGVAAVVEDVFSTDVPQDFAPHPAAAGPLINNKKNPAMRITANNVEDRSRLANFSISRPFSI